jgi:hypothetical protein
MWVFGECVAALEKEWQRFPIYYDGNISELGDIGMSPGKSFLFFLTSDCKRLSLKFWIAQS